LNISSKINVVLCVANIDTVRKPISGGSSFIVYFHENAIASTQYSLLSRCLFFEKNFILLLLA